LPRRTLVAQGKNPPSVFRGTRFFSTGILRLISWLQGAARQLPSIPARPHFCKRALY
jgi:hypothetical protein